MALKLSVVRGCGNFVEYWKIVSVDIVGTNGTIVVCGYKDATARNNGKLPCGSANKQFYAEDIFTVENMETQNIFEIAYTYLKTLEDFSGSEDC